MPEKLIYKRKRKRKKERGKRKDGNGRRREAREQMQDDESHGPAGRSGEKVGRDGGNGKVPWRARAARAKRMYV